MSVPGRIQLCQAIWQGDLSGVKKWLSPENMERANWRGWNALVLACQAGSVDIVRYLKSQGANMLVRDKQGRNLLHHVRKSAELVDLLVESGVDVHQKDGLGNSPLHTCDPNDKDVVRRLLEAGASIYATDNRFLTPLAKFANHDIASLLLEYSGSESVKCRRKHCNCRRTVFLSAHSRFPNQNPTTNLFTRHMMKCIRAKIAVSCEDRWVCSPHPFMDEATFISHFFVPFCEECDEELRRMGTEKVGSSSVSYACVWKQSPSALRNSAVEEAMTPDRCVEKFPIYGETLRKRFVEGVNRLALLDRAVESFEVHVQPLITECVEQVLNHLSMQDLRNLILACGSGPEVSAKRNEKRRLEEVPRPSKTSKNAVKQMARA